MRKMDSGRVGFWWVILGIVVVVVASSGGAVAAMNVTYDGRSLIIDGQRKLLMSGSIHYPRSTPQTWPSLIAKAKEGGIDVIDTYVFWNLHEPTPGQYDFSGGKDLVKFIKEIQSQGLYVCLRIGPFIAAEWNYGGFPYWLRDVPGMVYRTNNEPFKFYMQNFTTKIVNLMKSESLYASQGGPIILSQIENEYGMVEAAFHEDGQAYVRWAADMVMGLKTGVPWIMCKQPDAPDSIIDTCNGLQCGRTYTGPNSPNKPRLWTENWPSNLQYYGGEPYMRSAEDIAFHVSLFIAKNGSFINYYMYHGGTNFGRTAGSFFITGYYDQSPLDEYGLLRQPKYGHLKELHAVIKSNANPILYGKSMNFSLGRFQEGVVFDDGKNGCVAFLVNNYAKEATVMFRNSSYQLLPKSIGILRDCTELVFQTAKVNVAKNERVTTPVKAFKDVNEWSAVKEDVPRFSDTALKATGLWEHTNVTKDTTDYLWYTTGFTVDSACVKPVLHIESRGHVVHAFVNNARAGGGHGSRNVVNVTLDIPVTLANGANDISILSAMVGLPNSGAYLEKKSFGPTNVVMICSGNVKHDLTGFTWGYQVGLAGEKDKSLKWSKYDVVLKNHPLTWFKTTFDNPKGDDPVVVDLTSMGKGEVWVNNQSIGRYWVSFLTPAGHPSQSMYHIPRSFLSDGGNQLVVLEEEGGDPLGISLSTVSVT